MKHIPQQNSEVQQHRHRAVQKKYRLKLQTANEDINVTCQNSMYLGRLGICTYVQCVMRVLKLQCEKNLTISPMIHFAKNYW